MKAYAALRRMLSGKARRKLVAYDGTYLEMCRTFKRLSKCVSHQVACLLVRDNRIISSGINGTAPGFDNCCDVFKKHTTKTKKAHDEFSDLYEFHAEENAILWAAKAGTTLDGATAYCTLQPCFPCLKKLHAAGIKRIVYLEAKSHRSDKTNQRDKYAKKVGIKVEMFKEY